MPLLDVLGDWLQTNSIGLLNGLARGLVLFAVAAGLTLVFGLMDILNLAHGAVYLLGSYLALQIFGTGPGTAELILAVTAAAVVGATAGLLLSAALRPVARRGHLIQALLTVGIAFVLRDLIALLWGRDVHSVPTPTWLTGSATVLGSEYPKYRLAAIVAATLLAVLIYVVFERTIFGALLRAGVHDAAMLSAMGVNVRLIELAVLAFGSALAVIAGVFAGPLFGARPGLDWEILLLALIVVVIGGLGSIRGALLGALIVGQIESLGPVIVPQFAPFLLFGSMGIVLLFRPAGLVPVRSS